VFKRGSDVRRFRLAALAAVVVVVAVVVAARAGSGSDPGFGPALPVTVGGLASGGSDPGTVSSGGGASGGGASSRPIAPGFVGLSIEYTGLEGYAGTDPAAVNPVFEALVRGLAPGQAPVLRFGGDSTDWTWWPVPGLSKPPGIQYSLGQRWFSVTRSLAQAVGARVILGINLEAGDPRVSAGEAGALIAGVGRGSVQALELGNEAELYGTFGWYKSRVTGRQVPGRPRSYGFDSYRREFASYGAALPAGVPLVGPATGAPKWRARLGQFVPAPRLGIVSLHSYPLRGCGAPGKPGGPTIPSLLAGSSSRGLAETVAADAAIAHGARLPLRIDELNSVSCGGMRGISDSFASALWALDTLFEMARVGVDGINIHTFPGARYAPFVFSSTGSGAARRWRAVVKPMYYGLLMFGQAAPPGSRLLTVKPASSGPEGGGVLRVWATRGTDGRIRVVAINDARVGTRTLAVRLPAVGSGSPAGTLERLLAPRVSSTNGVTLGSQSFGASTSTGLLAGARRVSVVRPDSGRYVVSVPAGSAALLTVG
jgi:hypothetical protein